MDWRSKVELVEEIRREYEFGIRTIACVSKKTPAAALEAGECGGVRGGILEADRRAPRKQRHTAHRIWKRRQPEFPDCQVCDRTVRLYVHERKMALGLIVHETFVPQSYNWGVEAQVD